jgi:two-component system CheB/CheR fusion protein
MEALQVTDDLKYYIISCNSPNKSLTILNGVLHLFALFKGRWLRLPIDIFFRSLALDKQIKVLGLFSEWGLMGV